MSLIQFHATLRAAIYSTEGYGESADETLRVLQPILDPMYEALAELTENFAGMKLGDEHVLDHESLEILNDADVALKQARGEE